MTAMIRDSSPRVRRKAGPPARSVGHEAFATVLPAIERALGLEHPLTLQARANLAYWTGQAEGATEPSVD